MLRNCSRQKTIFSCCDFDSEEEEKEQEKEKDKEEDKEEDGEGIIVTSTRGACDEEMTRIAAFLQQSKS